MKRSISRKWIVCALAALSAACLWHEPARAAELSSAAQDYIKLRAKTGAVVGLRLSEARSKAKELRGKVVELGGTINGTMSRQGDNVEGKKLVSFLLSDGRGGSVIIQCTEGTAEVKPLNEVRVLVRLDADADGLDFAPLVAIVREAHLPQQWREQNKSPSAPAGEASQSPGAATGVAGRATPENVGPELVTTVRTPTMPKSPEEAQQTKTGDTADSAKTAEPSSDVVQIYANIISLWNRELDAAERDLIARCILYYSPMYDLDHRLVFAVVACESGFNPLATSPKGAKGLGQLMPGTAAGLGVTDAYDIVQNLYGCIRYLSGQIHRYAGRSNYDVFCMGLASYNAGPGAVAKAGGVPKYPETIRYVNKVAALFKELHDKGYP